MTRETLFVIIVGICLTHGLVSPALIYVVFFHPVWLPEMLPPTAEIVFYGASLIVSTATLLISAVPAAIAERAGMPLESAMWVWASGAAVLLLLGLA
jgi:hypothetical protein